MNEQEKLEKFREESKEAFKRFISDKNELKERYFGLSKEERNKIITENKVVNIVKPYDKWTKEEEYKLMHFYNTNVKIEEIAKFLHRPVSGVYQRIKMLLREEKKKKKNVIKVEEVIKDTIKQNNKLHYDMYFVRWIDAYKINYLEKPIANVINEEKNINFEVMDCGFLLYQDAKKIILTDSINHEGNVKNCTVIPKNYILELRKIIKE